MENVWLLSGMRMAARRHGISRNGARSNDHHGTFCGIGGGGRGQQRGGRLRMQGSQVRHPFAIWPKSSPVAKPVNSAIWRYSKGIIPEGPGIAAFIAIGGMISGQYGGARAFR